MIQNNILSVLPFYQDRRFLHHEKFYAFGSTYPLVMPSDRIIPFAFVKKKVLAADDTYESTTLHAEIAVFDFTKPDELVPARNIGDSFTSPDSLLAHIGDTSIEVIGTVSITNEGLVATELRDFCIAISTSPRLLDSIRVYYADDSYADVDLSLFKTTAYYNTTSYLLYPGQLSIKRLEIGIGSQIQSNDPVDTATFSISYNSDWDFYSDSAYFDMFSTSYQPLDSANNTIKKGPITISGGAVSDDDSGVYIRGSSFGVGHIKIFGSQGELIIEAKKGCKILGLNLSFSEGENATDETVGGGIQDFNYASAVKANTLVTAYSDGQVVPAQLASYTLGTDIRIQGRVLLSNTSDKVIISLKDANNSPIYLNNIGVEYGSNGESISSAMLYSFSDGSYKYEKDIFNIAGLDIFDISSEDFELAVFTGLDTQGSNRLNPGLYQIVFRDNINSYYSEIFCVSEHNKNDLLKLQWYDNIDLRISKSLIIPYKSLEFKNELYLCCEVGKPKYDNEEEGAERDGYFFAEKQISKKTYRFTFLAPEYLCDVFRLVHMSDNILVNDRGSMHECDSLLADFNWQEQGDLASVEVEFTTDTVVKKIAAMWPK